MEDRQDDAPGQWIATASALVTFLLLFGVVGVYAYGRAQPERVVVTVQAEVQAPVEQVWRLISDPTLRPTWRPRVARVGRIDDDARGYEVWRDLNARGDRFDFAVVEREPEHRLVIEVSSVDQIGMEGRWTWELTPAGPRATSVWLREDTAIDNPLWRGMNRLTRGPYYTVESELEMLATHLDASMTIERL